MLCDSWKNFLIIVFQSRPMQYHTHTYGHAHTCTFDLAYCFSIRTVKRASGKKWAHTQSAFEEENAPIICNHKIGDRMLQQKGTKRMNCVWVFNLSTFFSTPWRSCWDMCANKKWNALICNGHLYDEWWSNRLEWSFIYQAIEWTENILKMFIVYFCIVIWMVMMKNEQN